MAFHKVNEADPLKKVVFITRDTDVEEDWIVE